jgi:hypothetical protein
MSGVHDLDAVFPIKSQTSISDKIFLLGAQRLVREQAAPYAYLEIGSFLGGSLAPFLSDPQCAAVLSVDERERQQPDSRGAKFDYAGVTAQTMIDTLHEHGFDTAKLETFDGSVDALPERAGKFDLAFIDGEHTDEGCFRDFLWTLPHLKADALVLFHDSSLVFRALKLTALYLRKSGQRHLMFKRAGSEMSAVAFGAFADADLQKYLGQPENIEDFYEEADASVLKAQVKNRVRLGFDLRHFITLKVQPPRLRKAY